MKDSQLVWASSTVLELSASADELARASTAAQTLYDYLHELVSERAGSATIS